MRFQFSLVSSVSDLSFNLRLGELIYMTSSIFHKVLGRFRVAYPS